MRHRSKSLLAAIVLCTTTATDTRANVMGSVVLFVFKTVVGGTVNFTLNSYVKRWTVVFSGVYRNTPFQTSYTIYFNETLSTYTYTTRTYDANMNYSDTHDPISWTAPPARRSYLCEWSETQNGTVYNYEYDTIEDHDLVFWGTSFSTSGLFPPSAPHTCYARTPS